jgi:hypothetical protein
MSYNEALQVELFCRVSDRSKLEQLGFAADSDFHAGDAVRMTRAGNRPLLAILMGLGEEGTTLFGYVTGARSHPPAAIAADGGLLSFVRCDHASHDPIVRVTRDGTMVGVADAISYWAVATAAMRTLGLTFTDDMQDGRHA